MVGLHKDRYVVPIHVSYRFATALISQCCIWLCIDSLSPAPASPLDIHMNAAVRDQGQRRGRGQRVYGRLQQDPRRAPGRHCVDHGEALSAAMGIRPPPLNDCQLPATS